MANKNNQKNRQAGKAKQPPKLKRQSGFSQKTGPGQPPSNRGSKKSNFLRKAINLAVPAAMGAIGTSLGGPVAGNLFSAVGSKITGSGDYRITNTGAAIHDIPTFGNILESGINVKNREFIGTVKSSVTLSQLKYALNPGISTTFPFLSRIAANFEKYRYRGLVFYFKSTAAAAFSSSTNIALGEVIMTSVPDAAEVMPNTMEQLLNRKDNSVGKPSENILHGWECKGGMQVLNEYYIRTSPDSDQDIRFTDPGYVILSTNGNPAASMEIGQLWVTYDVDLMVPRLNTVGEGAAAKSDRYSLWIGNQGLTTFSAAYPIGDNTQTPDIGSNIGSRKILNNIYFPANIDSGYYMLMIRWRSSVATSIKAPAILGATNCNIVTNFFTTSAGVINSGEMEVPYPTALADNDAVTVVIVNVTAPNANVEVDEASATFSGTIVSTILLTEINGGFMEQAQYAADLKALLSKLGLKKKTVLSAIKEINMDKDNSWNFD